MFRDIAKYCLLNFNTDYYPNFLNSKYPNVKMYSIGNTKSGDVDIDLYNLINMFLKYSMDIVQSNAVDLDYLNKINFILLNGPFVINVR